MMIVVPEADGRFLRARARSRVLDSGGARPERSGSRRPAAIHHRRPARGRRPWPKIRVRPRIGRSRAMTRSARPPAADLGRRRGPRTRRNPTRSGPRRRGLLAEPASTHVSASSRGADEDPIEDRPRSRSWCRPQALSSPRRSGADPTAVCARLIVHAVSPCRASRLPACRPHVAVLQIRLLNLPPQPPLPVADLGHVLAVLADVLLVLDQLVAAPPAWRRRPCPRAVEAVDHVPDQVGP